MYNIREYEKKDKEKIIKLWLDVAVEEYGYKEWEDEIKMLGVTEYDQILVAVCEGKIVGTMAYKKVDERIAELKRVYIYKEFRGKGIAKELYDKIIEIIREKKFEKVIVETWENFKSGINFYNKNNFKLILKDNKRYVFLKEIY